MANNEKLDSGSFEDKKVQDSLLLEKINRLEEENKGLKEAIKNLMNDELTGLKRRAFFIEKSEQDLLSVISSEKQETENRKEGFKDISFLFCDIDYFKTVNDEYGHDFGDEILKEIALIIKKSVRGSDTVCRWGGEEMTVSLLGADENKAMEIAEELRKNVKDNMAVKYGTDPKYSGLKVSLSIGVSSFEPGVSFEELIKRADKAMYWAKEKGRNKAVKYSDFLEAEKAEKQEQEKK